jgi:hypothetical protein
MRRLLYVPIIHTESDLGSAAPVIDRSSASLCGEERWARHKATVAAFWQRVADYLSHIDATNLKIYQDGLLASGELGRRIVEEGARRGSKNYEIILDLMKRGAEIRTTEDAGLLKQEYEHISRLTQAKSPTHVTLAYKEYESHKDRLTDERDRFVARTINETLGEGEVGILFMGAYHNAISHLAPDILVEQLKEQEKVKAYFEELAHGRSEKEFKQLAEYLTSP